MAFGPLPIWTWTALALLLTLSVWQDLVHRRIPNRLLLCFAAAGLVLAHAPSGIGLVSAVLAALTAAAVMSPMYLSGWVGGGDLKLMGTAGLLVGMPRVSALCLSVAMAGGLLAIYWRWRARQRTLPVPVPHGRLPYAVAIALGTATHGWLG